MPNIKAFIAAWVVLILASLPAIAAMPAPPDQLIGENTVLLISINGDQLTPDVLRAAAQAVLGENAAIARQPLDRFQQFYDQARQAGVQSVCIIVSRPGVPALDVKLRQDADPAAAQKLMAPRFVVGGQQVTSQRIGDDLVLYQQNPPPQTAPSAARAKMVNEALANAGDQALVVIFAPTQFLRDTVNRELAHDSVPSFLKTVGPDFFNSRWTTLAITLGAAPSLKWTIQQPDAASAGKLMEKIPQALAQLKQTIAHTNAGTPQRDSSKAQLLDAVLSHAGSKQDNSQITLTLDAKALPQVAAAVLPVVRQARERAMQTQSMSNMRQLFMCLMMYAADHKGVYPDRLDQLAPYAGGPAQLAFLMVNPRTGDHTGYLYVKPADKLAQVQHPAETPILYELHDGKKVPGTIIGYADGHVAKPESAPAAVPATSP
jgi:hypothetical protein